MLVYDFEVSPVDVSVLPSQNHSDIGETCSTHAHSCLVSFLTCTVDVFVLPSQIHFDISETCSMYAHSCLVSFLTCRCLHVGENLCACSKDFQFSPVDVHVLSFPNNLIASTCSVRYVLR
jgi:hypothetical protein